MKLKVVNSRHSLKRHRYEIEFCDGNYNEEEFIKSLDYAISSSSNFYLAGKSSAYYVLYNSDKLEDPNALRYAEIAVSKIPNSRNILVSVKKIVKAGNHLEMLLSNLFGHIVRENSLEEKEKVMQARRESQPCRNEQLDLFLLGL